jgi:Nuclease A inhibitor-like protein
MPDSSELVTQLKTASDSLLWISESESPFEVFFWEHQTLENLDDRTLLQHTHHPENTPIETVDFEEFFEYVTQIQEWQDESEQAIVQQYQHLVATLKQQLSPLKVYRIGARNLDIYIIGQTSTGALAGLATKAVET